MTAKRALICGVTGQDGAYLAQLLLSKGYTIVGTSRMRPFAPPATLVSLGVIEQVEIVPITLTDLSSVQAVLAATAPDEVYHLAGQSSVVRSLAEPRSTWEGIATGTLHLLEAIRLSDRPIRFYHAGSSECFGDTKGTPADESTPLRPQNPYGAAKAAATMLVSTYREVYSLYACTGVLFNHESPLRPEHFVTKKIVAAACRIAQGSQETLHVGDLSVIRDWGWAPDYVESMYLMLQQKKPQDFVIATGTSVSLQEFVGLAFQAVGLHWGDHVIFDEGLLRRTEVLEVRANPRKAAEVLGWRAKRDVRGVLEGLMWAERKRQERYVNSK